MRQPITPFSRFLWDVYHPLLGAVLLTLLFLPNGCSADNSTSHSEKTEPSSRASTPTPKKNPQQRLIISPDYYELSQNPKLLQRIRRGPHGYFRYINTIFAEAVCVRFQEHLDGIPNVNLHGDAHLENYAITERGRGLTDFDDATIGPMVLDLVRFGVSIHLACRANGWQDQAEPLVKSFLSSYTAALRDSGLTVPPPELVARVRAGFTTDRELSLAAKEELMKPLGEPLENFEVPFKQYIDQMAIKRPGLPSHFFEIKKAGRLKMGVGSALDEKYLFEVEGATRAREDNLFLEIKEVRALHGISCILLSKENPMRPIVMQARLADKPYRYTGFIVIARSAGYEVNKTFWVHEWPARYHELSIRNSFQTPKDLYDITVDVGVQLGLGHPKSISDTYSSELRSRMLSTLAELQEEIEQTISDLTRQTIAAWKQFRVETGKP